MINIKEDNLKELTTLYTYLLLSKNLKLLLELQELFYCIYILAIYHDNNQKQLDKTAYLHTDIQNSTTSAAANGAITGFTIGFIDSGGELDKAIKSGVISGASAAIANDIGHGSGENWDWTTQALAHGVTQGIISELRGGSFRSGFISGVVGKVGGRVALNYGGDPIVNATIIGIFGGIASEASGGEFYEGAMRAAFVYLYNDVYDNLFLRGKGVPQAGGGDGKGSPEDAKRAAGSFQVGISGTLGAGAGGTLGGGFAAVCDESGQCHYAIYTVTGTGGFAGVEISAALEMSFSKNTTFDKLFGKAVSAGGSASLLFGGGYEKSIPISGNGSSVDTYFSKPPLVPYESHLFITNTQALYKW